MSKKKEFISKIQQHQKLINKVVFLYADHQEDRQDLRQEILAQAWKSYGSFRGEAKFSTWLYRVSLNVAISSLRKKKKSLNQPSKEQTYAKPVHSDQELLEIILQLLNPIEKSIVLIMIEGYKQAEIAEMLGVSANNIRVKIYRIREKLRKHEIEAFVG